MRRLATVLAAVAVVLATTGAPAEALLEPGQYQRQAFAATNAQRAEQGLRQLRANDCVRRAAVRQARLMAQREQMFHQDLGAVLEECGLSGVAENVAAGYASGKAVVNRGWMSSEGHRTNILEPSYRLLGVGARRGHDGTWYAAQVFGRK